MKVFKKFLSVFLISLLVFYQIAFFIPPVFAQEATESAIAGSTTEESLPEPSTSPIPSPTEESTPPSAPVEPSPNPEPSPEATATPDPSPTPILDISNETETSASASLSGKSTIRPVPSEKKIKKGSNKNYVEGQVLVKFKENKINLKEANSITKAKQFAEAKKLDLEETIEKSNVVVLETKGESVESAINRLEDDSSVQYAEPNYIRTPATISTNDTFKDRLWGLDNIGQAVNGVGGTSDADMDSPEAWGISEGNSGVVVAVIDSGVDYNHPDLQANMWDGASCKDENGGALNDCNHGYDFEENDKTPLPSNSSHGTHLAGTIAAVKNNNKGIIGVAPSVKIMALKFGFDVASGVKAIDFAIQNGAKIINASYTGSFSQLEYDAINRFKTAGGIFITAAGNESVNNDAGTHSYPSDYDLDNIISVTATDQNDTLADFSNYGATSVDVAAPGVNIYSTMADILSAEVLNEPFTSVVPPAIPSGWAKTGNWGTYDFGDQIWGKVLYGDLTLPYTSNADSTVTSATYNLSGASGVDMGFFAVCDTEYITDGWHDYMALEVSSNGTDFTEIMKWDEAFLDDDLIESNNTNGKAVFYLTPTIPTNYFTSNFKFRLHWVTDADTSTGTIGEGCNVDDILITKHTLGSSELYEFKDGTSMAAPHAAGLAALIWSQNSSRTYSQVKSIILNTGDAKASLSGKTVSGKRINAYNALLATNGPVISGLSDDTSSTKSKTWNWSSTDSTATFRFAINQSSSWTPSGDYFSTVTATQGSGNGTYYIHVQAKNSSGIESDVVTVSAVIDNTNPAVPGTPIPSPSSPTNQTTQTWNWTTSTDNIAGTITYLWSIINAATNTLFDTGTTTNTSLVTNLLQGVWNLIVNAKDNAGNQSATTTGSVTVDTTVSTGSITAPVNNSSHNVIPAFTASASDANTAVSSVKFQYKASSDSTFIDLNTDTVAPYQADWTSVTLTTNTTYNLQVVITDSAGNTANISGVSFAYDATAPNTPSTPDLAASDDTGISNSDNITNQTAGLTFSGTAEANSTVELFDGVTSKGTTTATGGNWSFDITLAAGTHSLTAKATDATGNTSVASDVLSVTIETTAPDAPTSVNLTSPINNSNKTAVTLTGTGEANNDFTYSITDGVNAAITGTGSVAGNGSINVSGIDVSGLNEGTLTASITLTDAAGNSGSAGSDTATKDVTTPTLSAVSISSNNSNSNALAKVGNMVTVSFTSNEAIQIPIVAIAGNTASVSNTGDNNWRADYQMANGDASGTVLFTINFNDLAGNPGSEISTTGDNTSITFDKTNPGAPVISNVATDNKINNVEKAAIIVAGIAEANSSVTVTLTDSANTTKTNTGSANGSGNFSITIDGTAGTDLIDGTINTSVTATDAAGNTSNPTTSNVTQDTAAPSAPTVNNISTDNKINNSEKAAIVVTGTAEANSLVSVTLSDGTNSKSGTQQLTGGGTNFSITIDGTAAAPGALVDGSITPSVTATDAAGNVSSATSQPTAIQDIVAPTGAFTINNAVAYTNLTGVTLNFSGVSSDVTQIQTADGDSVFGTNATYSSSYSYTLPNTQGTRTIQVKLIDGAGNISGIISDTIIFDSVNPVIETYILDNIRISPEASVGIKDTTTLDLLFSEAVEADVDILNSTGTKIRDLYSSASVTNPTPKTWDGKNNSDAFVSEGIYTIRIIITDPAGNSITDTSKTVTVNNAPLSLNPIGNKSVNEGSELTFTAEADDEEGGTLTFSLIGAPTGATINSSTGTFSWTPTEAQGPNTYTFTISVSSSTGTNVSEEIVVTVNEVNIAPVASGSTQTTDEDTAKVITLSATDADLPANTLTYSIVAGPSHGSLSAVSGNSVTYTPAANYNGSDSFTFRVNDGSVNSNTATINITVNAVNDAPTITVASPNGGEIWAGDSSHDITWNASDTDNDSEDLVIDLYYTTNEIDFTKIDTGLTNTGDYTWDSVDSLNSSTVKIKAVVTDPDDVTGTDLSNANFTIDSTAPTIPGTPSTSPNPTNSTIQTWNWTAATDTLSGVASYFWSVVNNANSQIVDSGTTAGNILSASTSLLQGVWNFIVGAQDNTGNQSSTSTDQLVVDTTAPTVTKLGNGSADVVLLSPGNINLVFSEVLSNNSKAVVENALTAGADKALTYSWSGGTLTITTTEIPTFANDVVVNVSDIAGNLTDLLLVDSALASNQKAPDSEGAVTVDNKTPQVVITNPTQAVNITIGSETTDPIIDVGSFISEGTGTLPKITIDSEKANIVIPASTIVTSADTTWNGVIAAPTVTVVTLPETSGETKTVSTAIEIGFTGAKLSFDKAVRILLPGQAGKRAGYIRTGIAFTEISSTCSADNQTAGDALVTDGECKIDAGSDLVIWTKHFTKFATYTQTTIASSTSNSSSSDGGGSSSASCSDQKPGNAPTLLSVVASGVNSVTLTWSEAKDPVTYYLVAYGTSSGIVQYGNPNIGGKGTTSYTVQGLSGGKTYYFKVRAGNGCTPGDFSNEVSATPAGVFITAPATGFEEGVLGESTDQPDQQQDKEEKGQEGTVKGVETIPTENSQEVGSFAQRNWPWMAVVILIISGTGYYLFIRCR
ncbi:S8 family serine peptidase [Candidatus Daviesbacteria bacterium]|nr:S8 family serine peptidase [Candidatus Daviesbacteria bacterium]